MMYKKFLSILNSQEFISQQNKIVEIFRKGYVRVKCDEFIFQFSSGYDYRMEEGVVFLEIFKNGKFLLSFDTPYSDNDDDSDIAVVLEVLNNFRDHLKFLLKYNKEA